MLAEASSRLPRRPWNLRVAIALVALPVAAGVALGTPASAATGATASAPGSTAASGPVTHPDRDFAGSTVRAHEGGSRGGIAPLVTQTPGLDVSSWQGSVNWPSVAGNGARFAYVKATEGTGYISDTFTQQYNGSYDSGLIRGAYHFALPDRSSGAAQADFFFTHGGGWSGDGRTLPPMLDIEYNPYGATCYGLSQSAMVSWIRAFSNEVEARTGRFPTIYTTTDWWTTCTGDNSGFGGTNPLFVARYASTAGTLPAGWSFYTFWQFDDAGVFPGDQDVFNGAQDRLQALADG